MEKQSDLSGSQWATSATLLRGNGLVSRVTSAGSEFHLPDISGVNSVITGSGGNVLSSNVYDRFGVTQASQGQVMTPWRGNQASEEGILSMGNAFYVPTIASPVTLNSLAQSIKATRKHPSPEKHPKKSCPKPPNKPKRHCKTELDSTVGLAHDLLVSADAGIGALLIAWIAACNAGDEVPVAGELAAAACIRWAIRRAGIAFMAASAAYYLAVSQAQNAYQKCISEGGSND